MTTLGFKLQVFRLSSRDLWGVQVDSSLVWLIRSQFIWSYNLKIALIQVVWQSFLQPHALSFNEGWTICQVSFRSYKYWVFSQHQCMFLDLYLFCQFYFVMMKLSHGSLTLSTTFFNTSQLVYFFVWAAVVTAVAELGNGKPKFYSTSEIIAFCRKWGLPTNHV